MNDSFESPSSQDIRETRQAAGLTQAQAGALTCTSGRQWQKWEYGEHKMHPGLWELFLIKTKKFK